MTTISHPVPARSAAMFLGLCLVTLGVRAADTNAPEAPEPLTPVQIFEGGSNTYNNWVELGGGGYLVSGNRANFNQQSQMAGRGFGGIEGFHFETNLNKSTTMSLDGRGIYDEHNYDLKLDLEKDKLGYLRVNYNEFRTWWDGDGGYFAPNSRYYPQGAEALALDRGAFSVEAGYTPEKGINAVLKYSHTSRDGEDSSTEWGPSHPNFTGLSQGLSPSFTAIHEKADIVQLDLTGHAGVTDLGLGAHYERGRLNDDLMITQYPGEPVQNKITDEQGSSYNMFDVHGYSESWYKTNVMLSTGFAFSHIDNEFNGSRVYGNDFDAGYTPNAAYGFGYFDLSGKSRMSEYVMDANLFYQPIGPLTIVPSVRFQGDYSDASATGTETLGAFNPAAFSGDNNAHDVDVRERLDVTYRGLPDWMLHARLDLTEASGNLDEYGGLIPIAGIGVPTIQSALNDRDFMQKHTANARWYALRRLTLDFGAYYKSDDFHYAGSESPATLGGYPGYLEMLNSTIYDGNIRATAHLPWNLNLMTRYEYQWATIHTAPDGSAGLPTVESSAVQTHIISENATWTPWTRLSLQTGFNYVISDASTPASDVTQAILDARNDYWTLNASSGLVLDNKTDLDVSYVYYQAEDYHNNEPSGVPYGAGGEEHSVTATLTRRFSERTSGSIKYGYFRFLDSASGGNGDFGASLVYATVRFRF